MFMIINENILEIYIKMKNLTLYRWKQGFHQLLWERIKESVNGLLPDWTYKELEQKGYTIYLPDTGNKLGLINKNTGDSITFDFYFNGVKLPAVGGFFFSLHDVNILGNSDETLAEIRNNLKEWYGIVDLPDGYTSTVSRHYQTYGDASGVTYRKNTTYNTNMLSIYITPMSRPYFYNIVTSNELDNSILYPEVSTMEAYYRRCVYSASSAAGYWTLNNGRT